MADATGVAEVMLGLPGFQVLEAAEAEAELVLTVQTSPAAAVCPGCGGAAVAHDRAPVEYRDLPCFGRPVRLIWRKRRHRCPHPDCDLGTWTEIREELATRCLLTRRAAVECCIQVGINARPVAQMARELGVAWHTVMDAVAEIGEPLVDDPRRVGDVVMLGIDETTWLSATRHHPTRFATGLVDLDARRIVDVIPGNTSTDVQGWLQERPAGWCHGIAVVATDLAESYRHALGERLAHATRVADPFHVVRIGNRCLDQVRRRVQNQTLGHRGRKADPLFRIRKLLTKGVENLDAGGLDRMLLQLRVGDPEDEVMGAWLAKESVRDIYLTSDPADAEILIDKAILACKADPVAEIRTLGRTLGRWRTEILAHHTTGASNGPTEALNLLIKKVKRAGHGFRNFGNYRLRILLHAGGVNWTSLRPPTPSLRSHRPR